PSREGESFLRPWKVAKFSAMVGRSSFGISRARESLPHHLASAMKTLPRPLGLSANLVSAIRHVFVWVPPFPEVLKRASGIPTTPSTRAFPRRNSTTYRYDLFDRMLSGETSPRRPPGRARDKHRSTNNTCGGTEGASSPVRCHILV